MKMQKKAVRKPSFFIVGAPKCGTTALWTYLRERPDYTGYFGPIRLCLESREEVRTGLQDHGQSAVSGSSDEA